METCVYVTVVEEKKVLKSRTNRGNKQLVIFTLVYSRNSRTNNSFFSSKSNNLQAKPENMRLRHHLTRFVYA